MSQKCVALLLCASFVLGFVSLAKTGEIDQNTRDMLETIMAGYHSNRAGILDISLTGNIITLRGGGESQKKTEVEYKYYELGDKRRMDTVYPSDADSRALAGRTNIKVFTGKNTLTYLSGSGPGAITASILKPGKFHRSSELARLDSLAITGKWVSHVGHIDYLLNRGWNPEKETIRVKPINHEGDTLLQVSYESTRGGWSQNTWLFDPQRGYEVVQAETAATYSDGKPLRKTEASYQVNEVAKGIWRPVDANYLFEQWQEDGEKITVRKQLNAGKVSANSGSVASESFTFAGMGLVPGTRVADRTFNPSFIYQFGVDLLPDLENILNETYRSSTEIMTESNLVQNPSKVTNQVESPNGPKKPTEELSTSGEGTFALANTSVVNKDKSTGMWVLVVLVLSILLGYITIRKHKSGTSLRKTKLNGFLVIFLSVFISVQAESAPQSGADHPLLVNSELNLYHSEQNICGITSLYTALQEIRHPVSLKDIFAYVPIEDRGNSLASMSQFLKRCGVHYQIIKPDSVEVVLEAVNPRLSAAILHVDNGTHFFVVKKTEEDRVSIIDGSKVIKSEVMEELKRRFSGTALIVGINTRSMISKFVNWKLMYLMVGVVAIGFGAGTLMGKFRLTKTNP